LQLLLHDRHITTLPAAQSISEQRRFHFDSITLLSQLCSALGCAWLHSVHPDRHIAALYATQFFLTGPSLRLTATNTQGGIVTYTPTGSRFYTNSVTLPYQLGHAFISTSRHSPLTSKHRAVVTRKNPSRGGKPRANDDAARDADFVEEAPSGSDFDDQLVDISSDGLKSPASRRLKRKTRQASKTVVSSDEELSSEAPPKAKKQKGFKSGEKGRKAKPDRAAGY